MAASRHLWVGGLPEDIGESGIKDYFSKFGKIEGVKILPQRYPNIGVAAFIDFYSIQSAIEAKEAKHKINGCDIRTNFKSKPADSTQRKWQESPSIEKKEKQERARGHESSSSSSDSESDSNAGNSSSSSSSSSSSESDKEMESGEKKVRKKGGEVEHVFLKVTGLAHRPERVLQDGLYYEFTRHSPGAVVMMYGEEGQEMPWAVVRFKTAKECKAAYSHAQGLALFGSKIKLTPLNVDDFPPGGRNPPLHPHGAGPPGGPMGGGGHMPHPFSPSDDIDPQATRSLFVGNIPKNISVYQLRDIFQRYGDVLDVEIKKMSGNATYGFVLFYDLMSAIHAKQYMDGENIHGNHIRVGFGKGTPSKTLWVDGIDPNIGEAQLERHMSKHGRVLRLGIDRQRCCAMVQYDDPNAAKEALTAVKGTYVGNSKRLMTDFANCDARAAFFSRLEGGGGGGPPPRGFPGPGMYGPSYGPGPRDGGMMMPRPGMNMMGMGRGGFPPHGHGPPMDFYYNPYMDDGMGYYGGGRPPFHGGPGPMGMRRFSHGRGPFEEGFDEYEEELRAFSRKREWEKEHEKRKEKRKRHTSESDSDETDSDDVSLRRKKKSSREKDKHKKISKKDKSKEREKDTGKEKKSVEKSEGEMDSEGDEKKEDVRIKATQKSRDLREKLKKKSRRRKEKEAKSDGEASSESESSDETELKKVKKEKSKEKDRGKERERSKDKAKAPKKGRGIEKEDKGVTPNRHVKSPPSPAPKSLVKEPPKGKEKGRHLAKEQEKDRDWDKRELEAKPKPPEPMEPPPPSSHNGKLKKRDLKSESSNESEEPKCLHETNVQEQKNEAIGLSPSVHIPDTPESPLQEEKMNIKEKLESDLSSGEDFKDGEFEQADEPIPQPEPKVTEKESSTSDIDSKSQCRPVVKQREHTNDYERSPKLLSPNLELESEGLREIGARSFLSGEESDDTKAMEADIPVATIRKSRKLPRRYQLDPEEEEPSFMPSSRREKYHESKETRDRPERRHHLPPTTPSPPPAFVSHRRRHHHSPPPPEYLERRWHRRGRPYSPGHYPPPRRYSRSPPGYPTSPPHRGRSPFSGSPPPRPRTPIQRPRDRGMPRHRYESPPYNPPPRGKYLRRGSPPSPPYHRYHSPSPPPRSRSPRRRHLRHRSPSISPPRRSPPRRSPPRRSPPRRRERSHSSESERSSSRHPDDRYDSRRKVKRPVYSRTPSPRGKHHDPDKSNYQQLKRQRIEELHPKSPSSTPPPPKEEPKPGKPEKSQASSHAPPLRFSNTDASSGSQKYSLQAKGRGSSDQQSYLQQQQQQVQSNVSNQVKVPQSHYHQPPLSQGIIQPHAQPQQPHLDQQQTNNLLDLLRRYPVMWQGHLTLKNDSAAVQLHFLSGNLNLAKVSLPQQSDQRTPALRISQRMRLEQTQLEGVDRRMQNEAEYCLLLALPCGRDANDVRTQTHALKNSLITYLLQKQAAGIINVPGPQTGFVLHIFPPCPFSQAHLSRVAPDLLSSASDNCHLMIMVATM